MFDAESLLSRVREVAGPGCLLDGVRSDRLWHAAVFDADISWVIDDLVACAGRVEKGDSLMTAFGDAVEFAAYWQKPDNADRALAADAVREALMPVAEAVTAAPAAQK